MSDAQTARLLGDIGVAGLRKKREADAALSRAEATRGQPYVSRSRRRFRAAVVAEPKRDGKHVNGTQLLLDLCDLHEKPAKRRRADRDRGVVLAELERRGEIALEEMAEPVPRRGRQTCWLAYESMSGERLATELRGLTAAEAAYVRSVSLGRPLTTDRVVTWPSQSTAPILRLEVKS